jgi:hypothetical protein
MTAHDSGHAVPWPADLASSVTYTVAESEQVRLARGGLAASAVLPARAIEEGVAWHA